MSELPQMGVCKTHGLIEPQFDHLDCAFCSECVEFVRPATDAEQAAHYRARLAELEALLNTPETEDWLKGVKLEAAHQRVRWPAQHDAGKSPFDWFWLIGFLAQKAAAAAVAGDHAKARHHTISTGAALVNWHLALAGVDNRMRPGIAPPDERPEPGEWR